MRNDLCSKDFAHPDLHNGIKPLILPLRGSECSHLCLFILVVDETRNVQPIFDPNR